VTDEPRAFRRTQRERVEQSARLLAEAAIELIAEKGYRTTTAQEIGIRAGYSRAMVRERFGSKDALLEAILQDYEQRIDVATEPGASGMQRVLAPLRALQQFSTEDPQLLRAMFSLNFEAVHDRDVLRGRIRGWIERMHERTQEAIAAGQLDGSITNRSDADDISWEIVATVIGYAYVWIVCPDSVDFQSTLARWTDRITELLQRSDVGASGDGVIAQ
jgi:AcrR family transcriptional regulator